MPVWLLAHGLEKHSFDSLDEGLVARFREFRSRLPSKKPVAVVIESPGGDARSAYRLAKLLRRRCGHFVAVVPSFAKSAGTLLALGADTIILGPDAELGPLDAQVGDPGREEWMSALDEVQALDRLFAFALQSVDSAMFLLVPRTGKKTESLLPITMEFAAEFMRPLTEKIDAVHYTQMSRLLKVAEQYATRLLEESHGKERAAKIARQLVHGYPMHDFVIDGEEAARIGLRLQKPTGDQEALLEELSDLLVGITAIGEVEEVK